MATIAHLNPLTSGAALTRDATPALARPLRGLARRRARTRRLFAAGYFALVSIDLLTAFLSARPIELWGYATVRSLYAAFIDAATWWSCIAIADSGFQWASARMRYSVAAVLAAAVSLFLHWLTETALFEPPWGRAPSPSFLIWWQMGLMGLWRAALATVVYAFRLRLVTDAAVLDSARLERATRSRQKVESQLQAMQGHIEPTLLFDALDDIERACDGEPARADAILDRLVDYLRAVLPRALESPSTVRSELDVVRAWIALLNARRVSTMEVGVEATEEALAARVPPMLLLPLAQRMSASVPPPDQILVVCDTAGARLHIAMEAAGAAAPVKDAFADVLHRLEDIFGAAASLVHAQATRATVVTLTLPHERARSSRGRMAEGAARDAP